MAVKSESVESQASPPDVQEYLALVERVAASQELRRAARLREFLLYVSHQALEHGATNIHEQEIGEAVFGRPRAYDTNVDNIVRVNATGLRKRLQQYFAEEGAQEPITFDIPRGGYTPVFHRRAVVEDIAAATPPSTTQVLPRYNLAGGQAAADEVAPKAADTWLPRVWLLICACIALLIACGVLFWQNRELQRQHQPWTREPALRSFWSELFSSDGQTDLVLADTSFALAEDILQRDVTLGDYLNYNYKQMAESSALTADRRSDLKMVLERNNGSIGDFRVAQQILALDLVSNTHGAQRTTLKFSRDFTIDQAKHDRLILIGSQESNPWVDLFVDRLNFFVRRDSGLARKVVVNRAPMAGEQASYPLTNAVDGPGTGYGVIAYLPGLSGNSKTLILEGTDSQATAAAGEFITNEESLATFAKKFPAGPTPSFEILLRTSQMSGTPLHAEIVAYRIAAMAAPGK